MAGLLTPDSESGQARLRWTFRILFVLLAVHFVMTYVRPDLLGIAVITQYRKEQAFRSSRVPAASGDKAVVVRDGRRYLNGGDTPEEYFLIDNFQLDTNGLKYGLGRERFEALIKPKFVTADATSEWLLDDAPVLAVKIGDEVKVYQLSLMRTHEVVNDEVGGVPVFVGFCVLANLGAVYERTIYTFGVSGYTYSDPDVWKRDNAFVLWDRDTESLWWPPMGKAVSRPMNNTPMKVLEQSKWAQAAWGSIKSAHPSAVVLKRGQTMRPPGPWPRHDPAAEDRPIPRADEYAQGIAPQWGENADLEF